MKPSTKATLLLLAFLVIDLITSYYTSELAIYLAFRSKTLVLWQDYMFMCVVPCIIYSFIFLVIWARLCDIFGWDKKYRSPYQ